MNRPSMQPPFARPESMERFVSHYFFLSHKASCPVRDLEAWKQAMLEEFQQDEKAFMDQLNRYEGKWNQKVEEIESELQTSPAAELLVRWYKEKNGNKAGGIAHLRQLVGISTSLILQNVSILTEQNHLKKKDIRLLMEILTSPDHLRPCIHPLIQPILQSVREPAGLMTFPFLMDVLAKIQLVSQYYVDCLQGFEGRRLLCRELLSRKSLWKEETPPLCLSPLLDRLETTRKKRTGAAASAAGMLPFYSKEQAEPMLPTDPETDKTMDQRKDLLAADPQDPPGENKSEQPTRPLVLQRDLPNNSPSSDMGTCRPVEKKAQAKAGKKNRKAGNKTAKEKEQPKLLTCRHPGPQ